MPRLRRVFGAVVPAVVVLGSVVAGLSGAASAAGPATIVASQSTGLADGQSISVSGTGYSPASTVVVVECNDDPNQPTVSLGSTPVGVSCSAPGSLTTSDGSGDVNDDPFTVHAGVLGPPSTDSALDSAGNDPSIDAALYPCPPTAAQEALGDTCELGLADSNGNAAQESISFAPLSPVVSVVSPSQVTFGDAVTFSATVTQPTTAPAGVPGPTGTVSWSLSGPGSPTCVDSTLSSGSATCTVPMGTEGDYIATATYSGDANYASESSTGGGTQVGNPDLTDQSVSFTSTAPSAAIVGGTYTPTAAATSGLTPVITVDPSSSGACSIDGSGVVTFEAPGTCTLDANQAGDDSFNPAPQVQQSFTVSPALLPHVSSIAPAAGLSTGGTSVVISGTNLAGASAVDFGTNPAASITSDSSTSVTAVSPAGTGWVDVTVTSAGGTSPLVPADTFTYVAQSPGAVSCVVTDTTDGSTTSGSLAAGSGNAVTGVHVGDHINWVCSGLNPSQSVGLIEASPLLTMDPANQGIPQTGTNGDILGYADLSAANLSITASSQGVIDASLTAVGSFQSNTPPNPTIDCPPTQAEANLGAIGCTATLFDLNSETALSAVTLDYANQASPAAPRLALAGSDVSPGGATLVPQNLSGSWWGAGVAGAGTQGSDPLTVTVTDPSRNPVPGVFNSLGVPPASYTLGQAAPAPLQLTGTVQLPSSVVTDGFYQLTVSEPNLVSASPATIVASVSFLVTSPGADQSVSFTSTAPSGAMVGDTYTPSAAATSGLTPVVTVDPSSLGACSIDDSGVVTLLAAGTCTLDANQAGNATFSPAPQVQQSFTVNPAPTPQVTSIAPATGLSTGGTSVVISGTNLAGVSAVDFGTNPAASITSDSSTSVTAVSPAGTGSVDVTVTSGSGTSPLVPADIFTYVPPSSGGVSCVVTDTTDGSTVNASAPSAAIDNAVTGVSAGDHLSWVCSGLSPSEPVALVEASPLAADDLPTNEPAYADIGGANLSITASAQGIIDTSLTAAGSFGSPPNTVDCPPTQAEANLGAIGCTAVLVDINTDAELSAVTLDYANQAAPQTPQLSLAGGSTVSPVGATLVPQNLSGSWWGAGVAGAGAQGTDPLTVTVTDPSGNPVPGVSNNLGVLPASYTLGQAAPAPLQLTGTVQLPSSVVTDGFYQLTVSEPNLVSASPATIVASVSFLVTSPGADQSVSFTSTAPSGAIVGGTYATTAAATSGLTPVVTVDPSSLGACSIDDSGVVSFLAAGTCTLDANQAGNATFSPAAQVQQSFTVNPANQAPVFTSAAAANAAVGQPLAFTVTTTGFPIAALTSTGTLPSGVTFANNGNGTATLAGTPTGTVKTYSLKFTAKNTVGTATQTFSLVLGQAPAISSAATTTFTAGKAGTFKVTTTGSPAPALTSVGALPSGVTFVDNGNGTATLAGSAGASGTYPLTITATNAAGATSQTFSLVVNSVPAITSPATTNATIGQALSFTVTTSGSPTPALTLTGTPPSGVDLVDNGDGTGTLTGIPAAGTAKTYALKITAKNAAGSVTQSFSLVVTQAPAITSAATTTFVAAKAGTFKVTTTGSPAPALTSVGALPSGVTFVDNGNGTATLSGSAGASGTYPLTITATNAAGATSQTFSLVVNSVPAVTSLATATAIVGQPLSFTVTTSGSPTPALTLTGTPPSGVSLVDNGDGTATLSGTPTGTAKTYALTITAKNAAGSVNQSFSLVVTQAPAITSAATTTFVAAKAGTFKVTTTGSPAPALTSVGALPSGVTFVDNGNGTATLSGSAGASGTYPLTITATNAAGATSQTFSLVVNSVPAVTSLATATAIVGQPLSFTVTTSGSPTPALTLTGTPPSGVSLVDNGDGTATLSGTPTGTAKTYALTITAKNAAGSVNQSFSLVVTQAPAITSAATTTFVAAKAGTFKVTTTGSPAPALTSVGALPSGVTFVDNGNGTATLSGSAGASGTYPLTITATNAAGATSQTFSLVVNSVPAVTSLATATAIVGQPLSFTVTTSGSPTPALTLTGTLPSGVTFVDNGNSTATLSGTPTGTAKTYALKITAKNAAGSVTQSFSLVVGH